MPCDVAWPCTCLSQLFTSTKKCLAFCLPSVDRHISPEQIWQPHSEDLLPGLVRVLHFEHLSFPAAFYHFIFAFTVKWTKRAMFRSNSVLGRQQLWKMPRITWCYTRSLGSRTWRLQTNYTARVLRSSAQSSRKLHDCASQLSAVVLVAARTSWSAQHGFVVLRWVCLPWRQPKLDQMVRT